MSIMSIGQNSAMDGRSIISTIKPKLAPTERAEDTKKINAEAANVAKEIQKTETQIRHINETTNIAGRKIQFLVNEALGKVVVKIVDSETDKVIKEIPSADVQNLQIRLKEVLGLLIDEEI